MPEIMDVQTTKKGVTPEAHNADLAIQDDEHVNFRHARLRTDPERRGDEKRTTSERVDNRVR